MIIILKTEDDYKWYNDNFEIIPDGAEIKHPGDWIMRVK